MPIVETKKSPMVVSITIPSEIAQQYGSDPIRVARHLLEQAAVEAYRSRELSRGQVATMLGLDWAETEEFLARHQCDRHYDLEDLEEDRKNLDRILGAA
jgi:predicted HTH domain antitoxin